MQHRDVRTHRVSTEDNLADILTKPMTEERQEDLVQRLGMRMFGT